jgi:hypothetical protein
METSAKAKIGVNDVSDFSNIFTHLHSCPGGGGISQRGYPPPPRRDEYIERSVFLCISRMSGHNFVMNKGKYFSWKYFAPPLVNINIYPLMNYFSAITVQYLNIFLRYRYYSRSTTVSKYVSWKYFCLPILYLNIFPASTIPFSIRCLNIFLQVLFTFLSESLNISKKYFHILFGILKNNVSCSKR